MRVLVIAKDFPSTVQPNAGMFVLRQARALSDLGCDILVVRVVPHAPPWSAKWRRYRAIPERDVVEGIPVRTIRAFVPPRMLGFEYLPLQVDSALRALVARFAPDVVHGHFLLPSGQLAVRYGRPSVVTAHGSDAYDWPHRRPGLRRASAEGLLGANVVVAVSDFIANQVRALVDRRIEIVYNGADESVFAPGDRAAARAALGIDAGRFAIAFAGHPARPKGAFDLVDAVARLTDLQPVVLCAGPSVEDHDLVAHAAARGIDARLYGMIDHGALARLLSAADVFCLPSHREGLPASICEAMLAGRPVVATHVGGIPEIVSDGSTGYIVPPGNVHRLAQSLRAIAENPSLAERMGKNARDFARHNLTWSFNAQRYVDLYREALGLSIPSSKPTPYPRCSATNAQAT